MLLQIYTFFLFFKYLSELMRKANDKEMIKQTLFIYSPLMGDTCLHSKLKENWKGEISGNNIKKEVLQYMSQIRTQYLIVLYVQYQVCIP